VTIPDELLCFTKCYSSARGKQFLMGDTLKAAEITEIAFSETDQLLGAIST